MFFSIYDSPVLTVYFFTVAAVLGLVMGSFLHCAAWRIVRGESFLKGRSRCPKCGHVLSPGELVPVISWLVQKGRCRSCGSPIPARYPLSELGFSVLTVITLAHFDLTPKCLSSFIFLCCLFCLTLTDLDDRIIPDGCHVIAVAAWIIGAVLGFPGWREIGLHVLSAFVFGGGILGISLIMDRVMGRDTLGGGDIKLVAVAALYLGPAGTLFMLIFACIAGLAGARFLQMHKGDVPDSPETEGEGKAFPFGPALALSTYAMLLYGEPLVQWYLSLL